MCPQRSDFLTNIFQPRNTRMTGKILIANLRVLNVLRGSITHCKNQIHCLQDSQDKTTRDTIVTTSVVNKTVPATLPKTVKQDRIIPTKLFRSCSDVFIGDRNARPPNTGKLTPVILASLRRNLVDLRVDTNISTALFKGFFRLLNDVECFAYVFCH